MFKIFRFLPRPSVGQVLTETLKTPD